MNYIDTLKLSGGKERKLDNKAPSSNGINSEKKSLAFIEKRKTLQKRMQVLVKVSK